MTSKSDAYSLPAIPLPIHRDFSEQALKGVLNCFDVLKGVYAAHQRHVLGCQLGRGCLIPRQLLAQLSHGTLELGHPYGIGCLAGRRSLEGLERAVELLAVGGNDCRVLHERGRGGFQALLQLANAGPQGADLCFVCLDGCTAAPISQVQGGPGGG